MEVKGGERSSDERRGGEVRNKVIIVLFMVCM